MSDSFKNIARGIIRNSHYTVDFEQGDVFFDELLIDIGEPTEEVLQPDAEKTRNENLPGEKYSEGYRLNSEDLLTRTNSDAQGNDGYSELSYLNEISYKFSKMNTSARYQDSFALNPNTCHSDCFEALEQKSHIVLAKETDFKPKQQDMSKASSCFETRGLFDVSETPEDLCTKFKTLLGSNEKLLTLDNVRDIRFKNKDFSELNRHDCDEHRQHMHTSKCKDITDINVVKPDRRISSNNTLVGQTSEISKAANSLSNANSVFTRNTLTEKDKIKASTVEPNQRSKKKFVFSFEEDLNPKTTSNKVVSKTRREQVAERPKLKNRRISLPSMKCPLNELDTFKFDRRNSISFGLPKPNQSRKRLASSLVQNEPYPTTSSMKRRSDNQPDEPGSKFRKRYSSSTDAETAESRLRIRSSSDGSRNINLNNEMKETPESVSDESFCTSSNRKRGVDDSLGKSMDDPFCTSKKLRQKDNSNPMQ